MPWARAAPTVGAPRRGVALLCTPGRWGSLFPLEESSMSLPGGQQLAGGQRQTSKRKQMVRLDKSSSNRSSSTEISQCSLVLGTLSMTHTGPNQ